MGLPIVLLFIFLIKSLTLEGAEDGVKEYIGQWYVVLNQLNVIMTLAYAQTNHCPD